MKKAMSLDEDEETMQVSKCKKKAKIQRKIKYVGRKWKETLKANKNIQGVTRRMKISQNKLDLLAQATKATEELSVTSLAEKYTKP